MLEKLIEKLKSDKDFYYSWQSNIAMAFYSEYDKDPFEHMHKIANQAAKNFLNLLIKERSK